MRINAKPFAWSLLAVFFYCCSDRKDAILDFNSPPSLSLIDSLGHPTDTLTDSVRYSENPPAFYNLKLRMADADQNIWRCRVELDSGRVSGFYQGKELALPSIRVDQEEVELSISPKQIGLNEIRFIAEDRFNQTAQVTLNLFVFENLRPVARLESRAISQFEYEFSAANSYDQDARFGGKVIGYEFMIDGQTFTTPSRTARHIFSGAGTYIVRLRVLDNNSEFSQETEERIVIN